jgi:CRP/FNR family cyclic AMP-dependent transcriptional regulator
MQDLGPYLKEHPFLKGMTDSHIELLVGCASNVKFDIGDYLSREGQPAKQFFFVRHGKLALELQTHDRGAMVIETIGEGDVLGWSWLFPPYVWYFDSKAVELTRAIAMDGECLRNKCEEDHELGYEIMKRFSHVMVNRLSATRLQLLDIYGKRK